MGLNCPARRRKIEAAVLHLSRVGDFNSNYFYWLTGRCQAVIGDEGVFSADLKAAAARTGQ
jgi:hypothetical protein